MLREESADQPMCLRRQHGSQRIADKNAEAAAVSQEAAPAAAATEPKPGTLHGFFSKPSVS